MASALVHVCVRLLLFILGVAVAYALTFALPVKTVFPSEFSLHQTYRDERGVCYRYQRADVEC